MIYYFFYDILLIIYFIIIPEILFEDKFHLFQLKNNDFLLINQLNIDLMY